MPKIPGFQAFWREFRPETGSQKITSTASLANDSCAHPVHPEFLSLLSIENVNQVALGTSAKIRDLNSPLIESIRSLLEQGAAEGRFRRGVDPFRLYVSIASLCFFYLANRWTLGVSFGRDLGQPDEIEAWGEHVVGVILGYLRP